MSANLLIPHTRASLAKPPTIVGYAAFRDKNDVLEWHQPVDRWQLLIVAHSGVVSFNGRVVPYGPRAALVLPPRARVRLDRSGFPGYEHIFSWFTLEEGAEDVVALPVVADITPVFDSWETHWSRAFDRVQFTRRAVQAWVWDSLWYVAAGVERIRTNLYVEEAERIVQERLGDKIGILELANELEISHSQLVRLFRAEHGMTIQEYIRVQRAVAAVRLLTTTTKPIKAIAAQVGVPDLQQFSRLVRNATGASPRHLRTERKTFEAHTTLVTEPGVRAEVSKPASKS
ncbi:MAG: helix-turn-helix transcriptional regulator [Armatimonadetes bacterium]|nr:helix-turn-helix transcriptional regulator [Armatimonadota bacterium]